jgi:peptidoglycan hydrolase-like protein with peptidoglycan-binding domain
MKKAVLILFLFLFSQVSAADFSSALEAYQQGDLPRAANQFKSLADRNDADAQYMLGYMYALGEGVVQDYIEAHKWLNIAASQGKDGARAARNKVARRMSRDQVNRAQQLARNWKPLPNRIPPGFSVVPARSGLNPYAASRETIQEIQQRLTKLGYSPGPADGSPGRLTRNAIRQYQIDNHLVVSGQITRGLVKHLLPGYIASTPEWVYPRVWREPAAKPNNETSALVGELQDLIAKIKSNRAADRWVVRELRQLVKKNQRSWGRMLMHERFSRRLYRLNRNWEITSGRFHINSGRGLQSDTEASYSSRRDQRKELAAALLNSILGGDRKKLRKRRVAQLVTHRKITNAFALRARFGSIDRDSHISLMLGQDAKRDVGYRLVLDTQGKRDEVNLVRVSRNGKTVINGYTGRLGLADGGSHNLEWTRDRHGSMAVAIDGRELFRISNSDIRKGFDRFSITNIGGNYLLRELMLLDAG